MRMRMLIVSMITLLPVVLPSTLHAQRRNITEKDLFQFKWIGDTQLSPDGTRAVFVETTVNAKHEGYATSLYLLDVTHAGAEPRRLTNGPKDSQPRWSPDGTQIAFVRVVEKDGKPQPGQVVLLSLAGGDPQQLPTIEKGAGSPRWSPDGRYLAVVSETPIVAEPKKMNDESKGSDSDDVEKKDSEHKSDVLIVTKAVYRSNGSGYLDGKDMSQIYVYTPSKDEHSTPAPRVVTQGRFSVEEFLWTPGSNQILYTIERVDDPSYDLPHNELDLVEVAAASGDKVPVSTMVAQVKGGASGLALSPDGKHLAFRGEETPAKPRSHQQTDLFVLDLDAAQTAPRNLTTRYDFEVGGGVGGDNTAPRGAGQSDPVWTPDGKAIVDIVGKQGSELLVSIDAATGGVKELTADKQAVLSFALAPGGTKALVQVSTPTNIGDLFVVTADGAKTQTQVTKINEALFSQLNLTMPQDLQVTPTVNAKDIDGAKIEAFVQLPPDFDKAKRYPLILNIHGGPHAAYGWVFDHEMQWMAAKGYVVVYPNPRGSTTYGQQFANVIQHNYPGDDFHDLMDSVDTVVKLGYVDPARMGVTGGSGGGLLTDWTVTQTNRFKAAVAQRDITDWTNWWYTADFTLFQPTWFEGAPFDHPEEFKKYSPITYVKSIQTPMMFILGDADYRTPPTSGGEDFYRALKYRHIDTVMVRFPGESHELSRSGQPWHRVERLENIVSWFDKYLMGVPQPQYDLVPVGAK